MSVEELKTHKFIVMGTEHYNPLGVIRSLGENGIKPVFIVQKTKMRLASLSKYCGYVHFVQDNEEALRVLLNLYGNEKSKPIVITTEDTITDLIDKNYDVLKDKFYFPNAGQAGRMSEFMRKENICMLAQNHGLNVPMSWTVKNGEIPKDIQYPVITKPMTSYDGWKSDYHICRNEEELKKAFAMIKNNMGGGILLQYYVAKSNELCLDGFAINRGKTVFIAIASTYTYILPDYYSMEMKVKNFDDANLMAVLQTMFAAIGFEGIFSVEFMIDKNNTLWFLEINFRNSTWSYAATKVGMNLPLLWASGMITKKIPLNARKQVPNHCIALAEIPDFMHRVRRCRMISVKSWVRKVIEANILYFFSLKDLKPFICYCFSILFAFVAKRYRKGDIA